MRRVPGRDPDPDIKEHAEHFAELLKQADSLLDDAIRKGAAFHRCTPHMDLFRNVMELRRSQYVRSALMWSVGTIDHPDVPIADMDPFFDLAERLLAETRQ